VRRLDFAAFHLDVVVDVVDVTGGGTAIEALAGVLGGTQSLHTNSYDEALALPSEDAVRIALRTQQIIAHETGVTNTIDPLGGSYFVEALTDRLEQQAYDYFHKIDELGGMVRAVKDGYHSARSPTRRSSYSVRSTPGGGSSSASTPTPRATPPPPRPCGSTQRSNAARSTGSAPSKPTATPKR
jgi:hypothetical protein